MTPHGGPGCRAASLTLRGTPDRYTHHAMSEGMHQGDVDTLLASDGEDGAA